MNPENFSQINVDEKKEQTKNVDSEVKNLQNSCNLPLNFPDISFGKESCFHCNFIGNYQNFLTQQYFLLQLMYSHSQHCQCNCHPSSKLKESSQTISTNKITENCSRLDFRQEIPGDSKCEAVGDHDSIMLKQEGPFNYFYKDHYNENRKTAASLFETQMKVHKNHLETLFLNRNEPSSSDEEEIPNSNNHKINSSIAPQISSQNKKRLVA